MTGIIDYPEMDAERERIRAAAHEDIEQDVLAVRHLMDGWWVVLGPNYRESRGVGRSKDKPLPTFKVTYGD